MVKAPNAVHEPTVNVAFAFKYKVPLLAVLNMYMIGVVSLAVTPTAKGVP